MTAVILFFFLPLSRPLRRRQRIALPRAITSVFVTHPPFARAIPSFHLTLGRSGSHSDPRCPLRTVWPCLQPTRSAGDERSLPTPAASVWAAIPRTHPKNHLLPFISYKSDEYVDLPCPLPSSFPGPFDSIAGGSARKPAK
ncbi:hypothetical protein R3P38DRAFT_1294963 [Favolaschia claudopus]|uniref:Secreted protein n=1 Tax=Favolaschia claudopus TaxID=2862362 RepID=A0AAW0AXX7_9AGAR